MPIKIENQYFFENRFYFRENIDIKKLVETEIFSTWILSSYFLAMPIWSRDSKVSTFFNNLPNQNLNSALLSIDNSFLTRLPSLVENLCLKKDYKKYVDLSDSISMQSLVFNSCDLDF